NIDSIERDATKALSEVLAVQEIDIKPTDLTVEPTHLGKVIGAFSKFIRKEATGMWAIRSHGVRIKMIQKETSQNWGKLERELFANEMYQ
ncbi:hypothetical protein J1N35_011581, partial [Gossypium stocksii]